MNRLGLESTDCTGVMTGNSDLDCCDQGWANTPDTADGHAAPLPVYPQKSDLPADLPNPKACALIDTAAVALVAGAAFLAGVML